MKLILVKRHIDNCLYPLLEQNKGPLTALTIAFINYE